MLIPSRNTGAILFIANMGEVTMAEEELQVIRLRNDFYRDGFKKMIFVLGVLTTSTLLLIGTSVYLFINKPSPVTFTTDDDWRILPPVPIDKPYLSDANLLQWVSETLSTIFNFDFLTYENKRQVNQLHFTENGLKKYNEFLNSYLPNNSLQISKAVVTGVANGGPYILNQGILPPKKYAWWVQMPIKIDFVGYNRSYSQIFVFQALIIRVPTLDNLAGVAIDNLVIVSQKSNTTGMLSR
ncbi:MAG: DotI/IcmL/TraM family protein [Gammaproteobacteria bacterium]|nr:DotI/IcmL/TraM family protein [Gammaproteobacteria bacterium]